MRRVKMKRELGVVWGDMLASTGPLWPAGNRHRSPTRGVKGDVGWRCVDILGF
ncbi:hypothetical protein Hdeb2414_s0016g00485191 [Helianthus debilis subsp. tardiflorus]